MISKLIFPILVVVLFSDIFIYCHFLRHLRRHRTAASMAWLIQSLIIIIYGVGLSFVKDFSPRNPSWLYVYLLLLSMWIVPKFVFAGCSLLGWGHCVYHKTRTNWGNRIGIVAAVLIAFTALYGYTWGFNTFVVRHEVYYSKDLPKAFNGYKIVQFSDVHVGTYTPWRAHILHEAMDSINAQGANMIIFTGDLQNLRPSEVLPHEASLGSLKAPDGVISILGNHDYSVYVTPEEEKANHNFDHVLSLEDSLHWTLLRNENRIIRRGTDSIVVAGMEYEGMPGRCKSYGNLQKTLRGVNEDSAFVLMLQHDPGSWHMDIMRNCKAQLTLSGHTHGGQIRLFGWSPMSLVCSECDGMYYDGDRALNVSSGMGGLVPFRFWCPNEIVVIELRCK